MKRSGQSRGASVRYGCISACGLRLLPVGSSSRPERGSDRGEVLLREARDGEERFVARFTDAVDRTEVLQERDLRLRADAGDAVELAPQARLLSLSPSEMVREAMRFVARSREEEEGRARC